MSGSTVQNLMHNHGEVACLVYEDGATQASPPGLTGLVEGAVVCNNDHVDVDALVTGLLRSKAEVEAVAGVVLHDEKYSGRTCGRSL